ncbi:hypothetical protein Rhal01_01297 [Rubritalea halochordaticola]|uniref:Lipoprotein n=1 Tax=Rubritalea halochordaticola TaxID=714537 RepID=A0ABP9UZF6_9BACT
MNRLLFLLSLPLLLTSCGGITHYVHKDAETRSGQMTPVTLKAGEEKLMLKHTQGIAIVGGYKEGISVEDSSIAQVRYGDGSEADSYAPKAYLIGKKPGITRAVYTNRLAPHQFAEQYETPATSSFKVIVEE